MSDYYKAKRSKNIYDPNDPKPFKISRSKIDLFQQCPRCFYVDRRLGVGRPPSFPFTLNNAVDFLLKKEFDLYRRYGKPHPLIEKYGVDACPVYHKDLEQWRRNFAGVQLLHAPTNFIIFGAIDDLWQNSKGEFLVVDYKATASQKEITELNKGWHKSYKRQMEVYQWLLRGNGYSVSNTGYFVYCNGQTNRETFDGSLEFDLTLIPYEGNDSWVEQTISDIHRCLLNGQAPSESADCDYCAYRIAAEEVLKI